MSRRQSEEWCLCIYKQLEVILGAPSHQMLSSTHMIRHDTIWINNLFVKTKATTFLGTGPNMAKGACSRLRLRWLHSTHLYQASDIGYVWRGVTHSLIFLHLERKDTGLLITCNSDGRCTTPFLVKRGDGRSGSQNPKLTILSMCKQTSNLLRNSQN